MYISSISNDKIKSIAKLNKKKYRDISSMFLIEGIHSIKEAYKNNYLQQIILLDGEESSINIDTIIVSKKVMDYVYKLPSTPKIIGVCKKTDKNNIGNKVIMLDNIQDPGNLGTIVRSAVAFNFDTIIISDDSIDLYNEKVLRSTEGMIFNINIIKTNLIKQILDLKQKNYTIYGTDVKNGISLDKIEFNDKTAIIMGNEGNGIKEETKKLCDNFIYINMNKNCESLNVSVAASLIMYEASI